MNECPVCGEDHTECTENLLSVMSFYAYSEAKKSLSAQGFEVLGMVSHAVDALGVYAYDDAENMETLHVDEVRIIEFFLARQTLINAARQALREEHGS